MTWRKSDSPNDIKTCNDTYKEERTTIMIQYYCKIFLTIIVDDRVCLSGLHACGDLSATMIKVFVNLDCAKTLSSVGCCYMKLSCEAETSR